MKKLYIKQRVFKITDHYDVLDELQNPVYHVDQDLKLIGNTVHVSDANGEEIFVLDKELFALLPTYVVKFSDGKEIEIKSKFSIFNRKLNIQMSGRDISVSGSFFDYDFQIFDGVKLIGEIKKEFLTWSDVFEITIYDENLQDIILGIVIAIDHIKDMEK